MKTTILRLSPLLLLLLSAGAKADSGFSTCLDAVFTVDDGIFENEREDVIFKGQANDGTFYVMGKNGMTPDADFRLLHYSEAGDSIMKCKNVKRHRRSEENEASTQQTKDEWGTNFMGSKEGETPVPQMIAAYYIKVNDSTYRFSCSVGKRDMLGGMFGTRKIEACDIARVPEGQLPSGVEATACVKGSSNDKNTVKFIDAAIRHRKELVERCDKKCEVRPLVQAFERVHDSCLVAIRKNSHAVDALSDLMKATNRELAKLADKHDGVQNHVGIDFDRLQTGEYGGEED